MRTKSATGAQKIDKIEIFEKIEFFKFLFKIYTKLIKNRSILNKNLFSVTRRAGCLIPSRRVIRCPGKSSGGGSATF